MSGDAGERFDRLVGVMRRLRSETGCPWDRTQTLESLRPFVLEETYEVLDAIDRGDVRALRDEVGDLLFQSVFLAELGAEHGAFTVTDAIDAILDKLVRRHPHVFGQAPSALSAGEVRERWEHLKAQERVSSGTQGTILSGVPKTLPALLRAFEMGSRAAAVGFDWDRAADVVAKIEEEVAELRQAIATGREGADPRAEEEMGDVLFAIANLARKLGIEPEAALRKATEKFARRFEALERAFHRDGRSLQDVGLEALEREWTRIKREE